MALLWYGKVWKNAFYSNPYLPYYCTHLNVMIQAPQNNSTDLQLIAIVCCLLIVVCCLFFVVCCLLTRISCQSKTYFLGLWKRFKSKTNLKIFYCTYIFGSLLLRAASQWLQCSFVHIYVIKFLSAIGCDTKFCPVLINHSQVNKHLVPYFRVQRIF